MKWKYKKYFTRWYICNRIQYYFCRLITLPARLYCRVRSIDYHKWLWERNITQGKVIESSDGKKWIYDETVGEWIDISTSPQLQALLDSGKLVKL